MVAPDPTRPQPIELVVFDMDGTVVDSMGELAEQAAIVLNEHYGLSVPFARHRYQETAGIPFRAQLEIMFPDDFRNEMAAREYEIRHAEKAPEFPVSVHAEDLVRGLRERGVFTALVSATDADIVSSMKQLAPIPFDFVLGQRNGRDKIRQIKMAMAMFRFIRPASCTLYVGDTEIDRECAIRIGTQFLLSDHSSLNEVMEKVREAGEPVQN